MAKSQGYFPNIFGIAGNPFSQDFQIPGKKPSGQPILPGENKKGIEDVYGRPGPQPMPGTFPSRLPMAMGTPVVGNMGGMMAQAMPNAAGLGASMGIGGPGMEQPNVFSIRPRISYLEPEEGGLDLGGTVNIPIGAKGRINVTGGYQPEQNMLNLQGTVGQPQGSPGLGLDFFVKRNLNRGNTPMGMPGFPGDMGGQIRYESQF
jgi:hypothetical protein